VKGEGAAPPVPRPTSVPAAEVPGQRTLVAIVVAVVAVAALYLAREVLVPVTLAVLLSFVLTPIVDLLRRLHLPRAPAVILAVLLALGVILLVGTLIGLQVAGLAADLPRYMAAVEAKLAALQQALLQRFSFLLEGIQHMTGGAEAPGAAPTPPAPAPAEPAATPLSALQAVLGPMLHPLATTGIVLVVTVFVLLQREDLRDRLIRLAGATDLHRTTTALDDAARRLSRYFLAQVTVNLCYGVVISAGLWLIGLPTPILWGIVAALLRFVPYIGSILGTALPVALAAAVDPGWTMALTTAGFFLLADLATGQVVEPLVYGHSTGLSPVSVIVAALFWSWIWGPIGLILATPLTLCLVVLGRHVERLEFLDVILGDRPALSPPEAFYQRMLAADPDEALDAAEAILRERPLSAYYDEVALKGLQLAANDAERGVLDPGRLERVRDTATSLIADLGERPDTEPANPQATAEPVSPEQGAAAGLPSPAPPPVPKALPPEWRADGAVLCIAGRGPLDEAGSAMLAQLLRKRGFGTRLVPHALVARDRVGALDVAGARMVCVSYLEISGSPAHLRYLLRRLRARLPGAPMLVGLWPAEAPVLSDEALQRAVGADHFTASLHAAVEACVAEAEKAAADRAEAA
jgi:predicted PurR-regulated permease PerM